MMLIWGMLGKYCRQVCFKWCFGLELQSTLSYITYISLFLVCLSVRVSSFLGGIFFCVIWWRGGRCVSTCVCVWAKSQFDTVAKPCNSTQFRTCTCPPPLLMTAHPPHRELEKWARDVVVKKGWNVDCYGDSLYERCNDGCHGDDLCNLDGGYAHWDGSLTLASFQTWNLLYMQKKNAVYHPNKLSSM